MSALQYPAIPKSLPDAVIGRLLGLISVQAVGNCEIDFRASAYLGRQTPKMHAALAPEYVDTIAY